MRRIIKAIEFLAASTAVILALVAMFGYFQVGVPVLKIRETCGLSFPSPDASDSEIISATSERLFELYQVVNAFGEEHDGQIAYVDIQVEASSSSLSCSLGEGQVESLFSDIDLPVLFWMAESADPWSSEFSITVRGVEGGSWRLDVPVDQRSLPKNGQYRALDHGHIVSVEGPFFVEHLYANGFAGVTLYPQQDRVLSDSEISCARRRLNTIEWLRPFIPCF